MKVCEIVPLGGAGAGVVRVGDAVQFRGRMGCVARTCPFGAGTDVYLLYGYGRVPLVRVRTCHFGAGTDVYL